jgi:hypothetical protein
MRSLLFAALLASPLQAQTPMSASEFDAAVTGQTIYYNDGLGTYAGVEAYHPHNRVTWVAPGGICQKGTWFQDGSEICFRYEGQSGPVCWTFFQTDGRLMASPSPGAAPWEAFRITTDPIPCTSPFVGS